jgi:SnoaL-like polyketide cyclase
LDLVGELFSPDYIGHDPTTVPEEVRGPGGFRDQTEEYRRASPDLRFTVQSLL